MIPSQLSNVGIFYETEIGGSTFHCLNLGSTSSTLSMHFAYIRLLGNLCRVVSYNKTEIWRVKLKARLLEARSVQCMPSTPQA